MTGPHRFPMTTYVVLGLVGDRPRAGYELAQFAIRSIAYVWPIAKSQVYRELSRLEEKGLISGSDVSQEHLPDKRVYELTPRGAATLRDWIADSDFEERFRSSALTKLFFARYAEPSSIEVILGDIERRAREDRARIGNVVESLAGRKQAAFPRIAALYGLRHAEAALAWVEEAREEIKKI